MRGWQTYTPRLSIGRNSEYMVNATPAPETVTGRTSICQWTRVLGASALIDRHTRTADTDTDEEAHDEQGRVGPAEGAEEAKHQDAQHGQQVDDPPAFLVGEDAEARQANPHALSTRETGSTVSAMAEGV